MRQAEVLEVVDQVTEGRLLVTADHRRHGRHRPHGVVVGGQGMTGAAEEEEMHGSQQQVRPALPQGRLTEQGQDVRDRRRCRGR